MISIIVPVYNVEKYLKRCIDSILIQTYSDFELILVNDGSDDNSGEICDEYAQKDSRIIVIHKENAGAASALNKGLDWIYKNSTNEWISIIDSDDMVHPQMLEMLYYHIANTGNKLIAGDYLDFNDEKNIEPKYVEIESIKTTNMKPEDFSVKSHIIELSWWGKLYHRDCFEKIRYPIVKMNADSFVTYRIIFALDSIIHLEYPVFYHFHNSTGVTYSDWSPKKLGVFKALEEEIDFLGRKGYDKMRNKIILDYATRISSQFWVIIEQGKTNKYAKYIKVLRKMMRKHIKKYKSKELINFKSYPGFYNIAYPHLVGVYYRSNKIKEKIKRRLQP